MEAMTHERLATIVRTLLTRRRLMAILALGAIGRPRGLSTQAAPRHVTVTVDSVATGTPQCAAANTVLTPGGPRSRTAVRQIAPGEVVQQGAEGAISIVPEQAALAPNNALVLTPGGYRPASRVFRIKPGQDVRFDQNTQHLLIEQAGQVATDLGPNPSEINDPAILPVDVGDLSDWTISNIADLEINSSNSALIVKNKETGAIKEVPAITNLPMLALADVVPGPAPIQLDSGWIAYTDWSNIDNPPISQFRTTWTIPKNPSTNNDQTIFLFNGLQNDINYIYQPVLQWGPSFAGGGQGWFVASWYTGGTNATTVVSPQLVPVETGDTLVGVITMIEQSGDKFDYTCEFEKIDGTKINGTLLPIRGVPELKIAQEALEAYHLQQCTDYPSPDTHFTEFVKVEIMTSDSHPTIDWKPVNRITDCQQHVEITNHNNPGGITIHYSSD